MKAETELQKQPRGPVRGEKEKGRDTLTGCEYEQSTSIYTYQMS